VRFATHFLFDFIAPVMLVAGTSYECAMFFMMKFGFMSNYENTDRL
jgi:hypothetical protein